MDMNVCTTSGPYIFICPFVPRVTCMSYNHIFSRQHAQTRVEMAKKGDKRRIRQATVPCQRHLLLKFIMCD